MNSEVNINPESLSSVKLKLFFKHLADATKKAEKKHKAKKAVETQISKLRDLSAKKGTIAKDELSKAIARLDKKVNELVDIQKSRKVKKQISTDILQDVFDKIDKLSVRLNAISGLMKQQKKPEKKDVDLKRVYELEQKIAKKLDNMLLKP